MFVQNLFWGSVEAGADSVGMLGGCSVFDCAAQKHFWGSVEAGVDSIGMLGGCSVFDCAAQKHFWERCECGICDFPPWHLGGLWEVVGRLLGGCWEVAGRLLAHPRDTKALHIHRD